MRVNDVAGGRNVFVPASGGTESTWPGGGGVCSARQQGH